jgi:hypothetical protein
MGQFHMKMREKIEVIIWDHFDEGEAVMDAADAIIAALPSMVKPLVWVHSYDGDHIHDTKCKYEIQRHDSGGRLWRLTKGVTGGGAYIGHYPSAAIAQAAADTYNVADVMAALTGEITHGTV